MSSGVYHLDDWRNALEVAEVAEFCAIDSAESGGFLAGWLCEEILDIDLVQRDASLVSDAIDYLDAAGEEDFDGNRLLVAIEEVGS